MTPDFSFKLTIRKISIVTAIFLIIFGFVILHSYGFWGGFLFIIPGASMLILEARKVFWPPNKLIWVLSIIGSLGFWDIIGRELYEAKLRELLKPSVVVFPKEIKFDRTKNLSSQVFFVKNRSDETQYNIEVQIYSTNLEMQFECLEVKILGTPKKKTVKKVGVTLESILMANGVYGGPGTLSLVADKEKKPFQVVKITRLEPKKDRPILVKFKSIRVGTPETEVLSVPIAVWSYSKVPGLMTSKKTERLPYRWIDIERWVTFKYRGKNILVVLDRSGAAWLILDEVCKVLGKKDSRQAFDKLNYHMKSEIDANYDDGTTKRRLIISENAIYKIIEESIVPEAEAFRKWFTGTLLPKVKTKIRKGDNIVNIGNNQSP